MEVTMKQELHLIHNKWMKDCCYFQRVISQFLFEGAKARRFAGLAEQFVHRLGYPTFVYSKKRYATSQEYYFWFQRALQMFDQHVSRAKIRHPESTYLYDNKEARVRLSNFYHWLADTLAEERYVGPAGLHRALNRYFYDDLEVPTMTATQLANTQELLRALAPYVVVCGSYARLQERNTENYTSDIDMFIRSRPRDEVDFEICNETYMEEILEIINARNLLNDSDGPGSIAIMPMRNMPIMFDMNTRFKLPLTNKPFYRMIYGVPMLCCVDDKHAYDEDCWDNQEWSDKAVDVVIEHPLPKYAPDNEEA